MVEHRGQVQWATGIQELARPDGHTPVDGLPALPDKKPRRPLVEDGTRRRVYERDGFRCVYCGSEANLTIDHVKPLAEGGLNREKNMVTACKPCNRDKGARTDIKPYYRPNKPRA